MTFTMFYTSESIKNRRFSGVINKHEPLQDMLKFLEMTSDVQFNTKRKCGDSQFEK